MKEFLIFVLLLAICSYGDARKVCILFEQETVTIASIVNNEESVTITAEKSDVQEDIVITLGEILEVTDEISGASEDAVTEDTVTEEALTEKFPDVEAISVAANAAYSKSTNICALEGITLFDDQNDLLRKMCTIKPGSSSLYVVTVQNSVVKSDLPLATLCAEGPKGLLSWISWQDFVEKVRPFLGADELPQLVVRNSSIGGPSESESVDPFSEVLIEMLPIRYKLVNMKPSAWNNNTFIKTVSLGNIELENSNDAEQHIEGQLNYSFPIETNTTFLSNYPINGLPVEMSDERKNFVVGTTAAYLFEDTFSVERLVPALKKEIVSLNGTFGIHEYDIEGKIVSIFGVNSDGSSIEESHFISARVVSRETYDIKESYNLEDYTATTTEEAKSTTIEELPIAIPRVNGAVYPGFKKFFYVASFLVFATFFIAMVDITRKLLKDRKAKRNGRRTYQKIAPKF